MAETVYILCAVTSLACAAMLFRGYLASRTALLFWSSICFAGLAVSHTLLVIDLMVVQDVDLWLGRSIVALLAMLTLIFGLVWDSR